MADRGGTNAIEVHRERMPPIIEGRGLRQALQSRPIDPDAKTDRGAARVDC